MNKSTDRYQEILDELEDCETCQVIWKLLNGKHSEKVELILADTDEGSEVSCPRHRPICQAFWSECHEEASREGWAIMDSQRSIKIIGRDNDVKGIAGLSSVGNESGLQLRELALAKQDGREGDGVRRMGRRLHPDWVDIDQIQRWKAECLSEHGSICENPLAMYKTQPRWVIDVETHAIASGSIASTYVALSYVWGQAGQFRMTKHYLQRSRQQCGLGSLPVAPIVRRAIELTRLIGERYLWVDALCIVQDGDDLSAELSNMGSIYASAAIVIVAAEGDAQTGLTGVPYLSPTRRHDQRLVPFASEQILLTPDGLYNSHSIYPYHSRGWTFQEFELARRRLVFVNGQVHWHCHCKQYAEWLTRSFRSYGESRSPELKLCSNGFPDLKSLNCILDYYPDRTLTYPNDALPAITGLLSVISRSFPGGFLFGLAEAAFEHSLCWGPSFGALYRRCAENNSCDSHGITQGISIPSWSYLGWEGNSISWGCRDRLHPSHSYSETHPITTWYTGATPQGTPRRQIRSWWYETRETFRRMSTASGAVLPDGWTRHAMPASEDHERVAACIAQQTEQPVIFKHDSLDFDDDYNLWIMPFPVAKITSATSPCIPPQTPYLFCETQKACLRAQRGRRSIVFDLTDTSDSLIGHLVPHNQHQMHQLFVTTDASSHGATLEERSLNAAASDPVTADDLTSDEETYDEASSYSASTMSMLEWTELEVVSVCRSRSYQQRSYPDPDAWPEKWKEVPFLRQEGADPIMMSETYLVLWVEWVDGIAYRLGNGEVDKDAWESLPLETIELCLG